MLNATTVLAAAIGENAQQWYLMLLVELQHPIVRVHSGNPVCAA